MNSLSFDGALGLAVDASGRWFALDPEFD